MCHAVLAMSDVSDPSMSTTSDWLAGTDLDFDARKVLAMLNDLEKKNRATKIYRFTTVSIRSRRRLKPWGINSKEIALSSRIIALRAASWFLSPTN